MKNIVFTAIILIIGHMLHAQVKVRGYYRSNGTYVAPHQRTRPNSTVTDNYSYPGNYNPNNGHITPAPSSSYNPPSPTSKPTESTWVNGYYRKDGTYVSGYYRNSTANSSSINSNSFTTHKYVATSQVNVRSSPSTDGYIYTALNQNHLVKVKAVYGDWTEIEFDFYNPQARTTSPTTGYIKSSLLSASYTDQRSALNTAQNTSTNSFYSTAYKVKVPTTYFYSKPDINYRKSAYLVYGEIFIAIGTSENFVYTVFTNAKGQETRGWISKYDIQYK